MPLLTTNAGGAATVTCPIMSGQRYAFGWQKHNSTPPTSGTFTPASQWPGGDTTAKSFQDADGVAISYDLTTASSGGFEFVCEADALLSLVIAGGGNTKSIRWSCAQIP